MTITNRWPRVGDECVDLRLAARSWEKNAIGEPTAVYALTATLVITTSGAKYHRSTLTPIAEGPQSARRLVPLSDPRVLCVQGQRYLASLAQLTENLSAVQHTDPADVVSAFAQIVSAAADHRRQYIALTAQASQADQKGTS